MLLRLVRVHMPAAVALTNVLVPHVMAGQDEGRHLPDLRVLRAVAGLWPRPYRSRRV